MRRRNPVAAVLAALAVVALLAGILFSYASHVLFDADEFADRVSAALAEDAVKDEVARRITDDVVLNAEADLIGFQPIIQSAAAEVVGSEPFRGLVRAAVADLHGALFERDKDTVVFTLRDIGTVLSSAAAQFAPEAAKKIPDNADAKVLSSKPPQWALDLANVADDVKVAGPAMLALALLLAAASIATATEWRRAVGWMGAGAAVGAVLLVIAQEILRAGLVRKTGDPDAQAAAGAIWDVFLNDLRTSLIFLAAIGAVVAGAARALVEPRFAGDFIRKAWAIAITVPEHPWLRALRAVCLIVAGILVIAEREAFIDLAVLAGGIFLVYVGASELLRMLAGPDAQHAPERERRQPPSRRAAATGAVVVVLIGATVFVFLSSGGADAPASAKGLCNSSREFCDRTLDEVTLAATHNSMSAAGQTDYLFPQQDAPIPDQLDDGIRGLFIDAHYGVEKGGAVATDLSSVDSSERKAYAKEIGEEGLDAALRIRNRIGGFSGGGERRVYLCHRFCELGALDAEKTFGDIRDFLVLHPGAVLVITVEDYVQPQDLVAAVEASGLSDYVYKGPLEPGDLPTLGDMVSSGGRVVLMAENEAGGAPWYHSAYDELLQETPFSFRNKPSLLIDPSKLEASCEPNRGPASAPLFLINHWIDTSPAAKPSNAKKVNTEDVLLDRVHECERQRDLTANLLAVDFYREGDVFDAVRKLNGDDR